MEKLLRNPTRTLAGTFVACAVGFLAVGWLSSIESLHGMSWKSFQPSLGFDFAAAFAQLVLAGVVWTQIQVANDALRQSKVALQQSEANTTAAAERERNQRAADAIATFVGHAANASALYGHVVVLRLRAVESDPANSIFNEAAREAIAQANIVRQAAYAARFQVEVRTSWSDGQETEAAEAFLRAVDGQHKATTKVMARASLAAAAGTSYADAPGTDPAPEARSAYHDCADLREACLALARRLLLPT